MKREPAPALSRVRLHTLVASRPVSVLNNSTCRFFCAAVGSPSSDSCGQFFAGRRPQGSIRPTLFLIFLTHIAHKQLSKQTYKLAQ